jgi:hypothetical protein
MKGVQEFEEFRSSGVRCTTLDYSVVNLADMPFPSCNFVIRPILNS